MSYIKKLNEFLRNSMQLFINKFFLYKITLFRYQLKTLRSLLITKLIELKIILWQKILYNNNPI